MTSSVKNISSVVSEITVVIPSEIVSTAIENTYSKLGRTAKISGFRKGKVPRAVLRRMYGPSVMADVKEEIITQALQESVEEHNIVPLSHPEFELGELVEGQPYQFKATVEIQPKLEKIVTDGISLDRHKIVVKAEEVDTELARLRGNAADIIELETPRPVETGDLCKIKLARLVDDAWKDFGGEGRDVIVGEKRIDKEIDEALIGMSVGDDKEVALGYGKDDDENKDRYRISVVGLRGRILPALDDEFAKDMGAYASLDALKESISAEMTKHRTTAEENRLRQLLFDALCEKNDVDLPPRLLARQTEAFQTRMQRSMAMLGKEHTLSQEEEASMLGRSEKAAKELVHKHLLLREVTRIHDLDVTDADLEKEFARIADENGFPLPLVKAEYAKEDRAEELRHELIERKIFDFIYPLVTINEIDAPSQTEDGNAP